MFQVPDNRMTYVAYVGLMMIVTIITFENLAEFDFLDGWDDWAVMADVKIMADDLSHMFSPDKHHKDVRPPVDLVFLFGYFFGKIRRLVFA